MKRRAKRASIFMIFLLVMQSVVTGIAPIQTAYAEENKNDTFLILKAFLKVLFPRKMMAGFYI